MSWQYQRGGRGIWYGNNNKDDTYAGEFNPLNELRHGYGVRTYQSRERYEGEFFNGKANGHGIRYFRNGDWYEGQQAGGSRHGFGIHHFSNGRRYEGQWKSGKRNGSGVLHYEGGDVLFEGSWQNDAQHGSGVVTSSSSSSSSSSKASVSVYSGTWKNGELDRATTKATTRRQKKKDAAVAAEARRAAQKAQSAAREAADAAQKGRKIANQTYDEVTEPPVAQSEESNTAGVAPGVVHTNLRSFHSSTSSNNTPLISHKAIAMVGADEGAGGALKAPPSPLTSEEEDEDYFNEATDDIFFSTITTNPENENQEPPGADDDDDDDYHHDEKMSSSFGAAAFVPSSKVPPSRCFKRVDETSSFSTALTLLMGLRENPPKCSDLEDAVPDDDDLKTMLKCVQLSYEKVSKRQRAQELISSCGLAEDEVKTIVSYTMDHPYRVFAWLNAWLRTDRRDHAVQDHVGPYFVLLYRALEKLPRIRCRACRGVEVKDIEGLRCVYDEFETSCQKGDLIAFWGLASFSTKDKTAETFAGTEASILYSCGDLECVSISALSDHPDEHEVIPLPPSRFTINTTTMVNNVLVIGIDQHDHSDIAYIVPRGT